MVTSCNRDVRVIDRLMSLSSTIIFHDPAGNKTRAGHENRPGIMIFVSRQDRRQVRRTVPAPEAWLCHVYSHDVLHMSETTGSWLTPLHDLAPFAQRLAGPGKISLAGRPDRGYCLYALFDTFALIRELFIDQDIPYPAYVHFAVVKGDSLRNFKFESKRAAVQDRNVQHGTFRCLERDAHFIGRVAFLVPEVIGKGKYRLGDEICREYTGRTDLVLCQLIAGDAGHHAQPGVPAITEPAEQPEIGYAIFVVRAVKEKCLGAEVVCDGSGYLFHFKHLHAFI